MSTTNDALARFVEAQAGIYPQVCRELASGRKLSHWMWFVFPQLRGLGRSETARHFGLAGAGEALAYLRHPLLGHRLAECCGLLLAVEGRTAEEIFGSIDAMKLRSSMTLFAAVAPDQPIFESVLQRYCQDEKDPLTVALLSA